MKITVARTAEAIKTGIVGALLIGGCLVIVHGVSNYDFYTAIGGGLMIYLSFAIMVGDI